MELLGNHMQAISASIMTLAGVLLVGFTLIADRGGSAELANIMLAGGALAVLGVIVWLYTIRQNRLGD